MTIPDSTGVTASPKILRSRPVEDAAGGLWLGDGETPMSIDGPRAPTDAQVEQFIQAGFVRIDQAFPKQVAAQARAILWRDLACDPDDPSSWTRPVVRLGWYGQEPFPAAANTPALDAAIDRLVGRGRRIPRTECDSALPSSRVLVIVFEKTVSQTKKQDCNKVRETNFSHRRPAGHGAQTTTIRTTRAWPPRDPARCRADGRGQRRHGVEGAERPGPDGR